MRNFPKLLFSLNFLNLALIAAQVAAIVFLCLYIPSFLPVAAALMIIWLLSAVAACVLFAKKGDAEVKCAWFVLIAALPVAGALIYFFASAGKTRNGILKLKGGNTANGLARAANLLCGSAQVGYDYAEYFSSGADFFKNATQAIAAAKLSVYVEFFIINRGKIFNDFERALKSAAENGAEIKIIVDGLGSAFRLRKKEIKRLKALGAEIKIFHRISPVPRARLNVRDHRKIIAVDGKAAFTGGFNLADEYANLKSPFGFWKDSGIAIYGAAAKVFEGMFLSLYNGSHETEVPASGKFNCLPFYDSPYTREFCEEAYLYAIACARERVHIMTPYFCPSERLAAALVFAARRGVDVRIILPHIPDKKYAFEISKSFARELSESGCKFYEFTPGFMHAKSMITDEKAFLGSYNFDYRSTHYNYECGVMFSDSMTDKAERDFADCLALSSEFSEGKISLFRKMYRAVLKLFAPLI